MEQGKHQPFGNARYIKAIPQVEEFSYCDPLPRFRREFALEAGFEKAELLIQSPGFATCYINGQPITEDVFSSPLSDYRKLLWYYTYDVTSLLREGKNVISVVAGNGFFNETFHTAWDFEVAEWRDPPQFLLALRIDGEETLVSDGSWRVDREHSPIRFSHLRSGEYYDARLADESWREVGFDDAEWMPAIERDPSEITGELRLCTCQPVREVESYPALSVRETARGYVVDFGVNISGYMEITLSEERDREISFYYTEELDEESNPRYNGMDAPCFYPETPFQLNKMIASGGVDTFKPSFCYHGFRYVLIEGLQKPPVLSQMRAIFTHNDLARTADFTSGNEVLNYIYTAGRRSTYSNLFWSLTDCPTREKLGWTNDAQASTEQVLINYDSLPLLTKWFTDIKMNFREDGALPGVVPTHGWGYDWGPVCDCLLYELPYRIYLYTGDPTLLITSIDAFERYANSLEQRLADGVIFKLGDWLGYGSSKLVSKDFVNEFYLLKAFRITDMAHRLAKDGDSSFGKRYETAKEAFLNRYLDEEGRCTFDHQAPLAMLLMEGIWREREVLSKQLIAAVERDECQLTCGMVGVQFLYDALAAVGRPDLAYRLITESEPGYRTWFRCGATTLWERWDGELKCSHNHHMYSGVIAWFYKSLLGVAPCEKAPGFEAIELCPAFIKELGYVKGNMETVRGEIAAEWRYGEGEFVYTVEIPEGITATFDGEVLKPGKNVFHIHE